MGEAPRFGQHTWQNRASALPTRGLAAGNLPPCNSVVIDARPARHDRDRDDAARRGVLSAGRRPGDRRRPLAPRQHDEFLRRGAVPPVLTALGFACLAFGPGAGADILGIRDSFAPGRRCVPAHQRRHRRQRRRRMDEIARVPRLRGDRRLENGGMLGVRHACDHPGDARAGFAVGASRRREHGTSPSAGVEFSPARGPTR